MGEIFNGLLDKNEATQKLISTLMRQIKRRVDAESFVSAPYYVFYDVLLASIKDSEIYTDAIAYTDERRTITYKEILDEIYEIVTRFKRASIEENSSFHQLYLCVLKITQYKNNLQLYPTLRVSDTLEKWRETVEPELEKVLNAFLDLAEFNIISNVEFGQPPVAESSSFPFTLVTIIKIAMVLSFIILCVSIMCTCSISVKSRENRRDSRDQR